MLHSYGLSSLCYIVMACIGMACIVTASIVMACIGMAYIVTASIVMACIVMAYTVMALYSYDPYSYGPYSYGLNPQAVAMQPQKRIRVDHTTDGAQEFGALGDARREPQEKDGLPEGPRPTDKNWLPEGLGPTDKNWLPEGLGPTDKAWLPEGLGPTDKAWLPEGLGPTDKAWLPEGPWLTEPQTAGKARDFELVVCSNFAPTCHKQGCGCELCSRQGTVLIANNRTFIVEGGFKSGGRHLYIGSISAIVMAHIARSSSRAASSQAQRKVRNRKVQKRTCCCNMS